MKQVYNLTRSELPVFIQKVIPTNIRRSIGLYKADVVDTSCLAWSDGSRQVWQLVNLSNGCVHSPSDDVLNPLHIRYGKPFKMRPGFALVVHGTSQGHDLGYRVVLHAENIATLLPSLTGSDLTYNELIVLKATKLYKSSYGGHKNYRFHRAQECTRITAEDWVSSKRSLIDRGYMTRRGAINIAGENALLAEEARADYIALY